ncbi:MAG TPA: cell division protein FtsL [Thermohalobaculum sp.]|nr:cell division protein FtsL [Thermohalobaculum sp.]
MSRLGFALAMAAVVAAAAWTYHVNYQTKTALNRVDRLRAAIAAEREAVEVLRVEWAYLNAPDRLARLVAMNNDRLGLVPLSPQHFDEAAAVPFPPRPPLAAPEEIPNEVPNAAPLEAPPETPPEAPPETPLVAEPAAPPAPEPPLLLTERAAPAVPAMPPPVPRPASWRPQ